MTWADAKLTLAGSTDIPMTAAAIPEPAPPVLMLAGIIGMFVHQAPLRDTWVELTAPKSRIIGRSRFGT